MRRSDLRRRAVLLSILLVTGLVLGLALARPHLQERAAMAGQFSARLQQELRQAAAMDGGSGVKPAAAPAEHTSAPAVTKGELGSADSGGFWRMSPVTARRLVAWAIPGMNGWAKPTDTLVLYHEGQRQGGLFQHYLPFLGSTSPWGVVSSGGQVTPLSPTVTPPTNNPGQQPGGVTPVPTIPGDGKGTGGNATTGPVRATSMEPLVGIYHTHDYESYLSEFPGQTFKPEEEYLIMTNDPEHNILKVGQRLAQSLSKKGVTTVWSGARHQENGYLGAYDESRKTARAMLKQYPSIKLLFDVHRDAGPAKTAVINGQKVAKVDIILGEGSKDLPQPHMEQNRALAQQVKAAIEQIYPGLFDHVIEKAPDTYNQDLKDGAILFEIGSASNSMEEALRGADLLANAIAKVVQDGKYPH